MSTYLLFHFYRTTFISELELKKINVSIETSLKLYKTIDETIQNKPRQSIKGKGKNSLFVALGLNCPYKNNVKKKGKI